MNELDKILEKLYAVYGTDNGVLFGIEKRIIVEKIVKFVLEFIKDDMYLDRTICERCMIPQDECKIIKKERESGELKSGVKYGCLKCNDFKIEKER